jgi:hypothetical protein
MKINRQDAKKEENQFLVLLASWRFESSVLAVLAVRFFRVTSL